MPADDRNLFRGNLEVVEDLSAEGYVVKSDEITVSVYGYELRHHNRLLLESLVAECKVKPPLDSIDTQSITYCTLFAYGTVRPNWDWERELFRDIALLSDTHLAKARLNRLKRVRISASRLKEIDETEVPQEMWQSAMRTLHEDIQFYESRDYFGKHISKLPPLERFFNIHDLEHPQIMIRDYRPEGSNQAERQAHNLALQVWVKGRTGRLFVTNNGTLQTFVPGNDPKTITNLVPVMASVWDGLTQEQKDLTVLLATKYNSQILAMLLVSGRCSPIEFAQSILQCEGEEAHFEHSLGENPSQREIDGMAAFQWYNETREGRALEEMDEANLPRYNQLLADALVVNEYLELCSDPILEVIRSPETDKLEFKSSFRWDVRENRRNDDAIKGASLKTLVAFLNSGGGTLVIGVEDDGTVLGIEQDQYKNNDEFERSIVANIGQSIGSEFLDALKIRFHKVGNKEIISIECDSVHSLGSAFLKDEGYYVRQGPQSVPLIGRQMLDHVNRNA